MNDKMQIPENKNRNSHIYPEKPLPKNKALIGTTIDIRAELKGNEDLAILGKYKGKIEIKKHDLFVESDAYVEAEIHARNITIRGRVKGTIHASGKVYIEKEGQMVGDISAARIAIVEGAQFKGSMKMISYIQ